MGQCPSQGPLHPALTTNELVLLYVDSIDRIEDIVAASETCRRLRALTNRRRLHRIYLHEADDVERCASAVANNEGILDHTDTLTVRWNGDESTEQQAIDTNVVNKLHAYTPRLRALYCDPDTRAQAALYFILSKTTRLVTLEVCHLLYGEVLYLMIHAAVEAGEALPAGLLSIHQCTMDTGNPEKHVEIWIPGGDDGYDALSRLPNLVDWRLYNIWLSDLGGLLPSHGPGLRALVLRMCLIEPTELHDLLESIIPPTLEVFEYRCEETLLGEIDDFGLVFRALRRHTGLTTLILYEGAHRMGDLYPQPYADAILLPFPRLKFVETHSMFFVDESDPDPGMGFTRTLRRIGMSLEETKEPQPPIPRFTLSDEGIEEVNTSVDTTTQMDMSVATVWSRLPRSVETVILYTTRSGYRTGIYDALMYGLHTKALPNLRADTTVVHYSEPTVERGLLEYTSNVELVSEDEACQSHLLMCLYSRIAWGL